MKRKILQVFSTLDYTYAVADDGSWWRILDPLTNGWVKLPDLPERVESEFVEEVSREATKPRARIPLK